MFTKSLFASKTFWVNTISAIIALLTMLMGQEFIASNPNVATYFVLAVSTLNVWLRWLTGQPVHVVEQTFKPKV